MIGLPSDFDAALFVGRTVEQVSFTENTISLRFDAGLVLTIEGSFRHEAEAGSALEELSEVPVESSRLVMLAGRRIAKAEGRPDGTLILLFEGGQQLLCYDDSREYECYHIEQGTTRITV